jgi:hypothetical protein
MSKTYAIIKDGLVVNKILADNEHVATRVSPSDSVVIEDNDGTYSIGDNYTD